MAGVLPLSSAPGVELLKFPDEIVLMILNKVRRVDLLACRLVCRRLGALALHPSVWRHRRLVVNGRRLTCPVLRLAPCLAELVVSLPTSSRCHPLTLSSTRCAASSLRLTVGPGGAAQGALIIRNQEALGRLRSLEVEPEDGFENEVDMCGHEAALLLGAVASTGGLQDLVVNTIPECAPSPSVIECFIRNNEVSVPVLERLSFNVCLPTLSLLNHVLAVNNATLTAINLTGFESMTAVTEMAALAPALATLAALRELACPLLPGLEAVAACEALEKVDLQLSPGTPAAARSACQFLLLAKALRHVALECNDFGTPHSVACDLFGALSAGATRASVRSVSVTFLPRTFAMPAVVQRAMLAALPLLPALRTVQVHALPTELLLGIKPATAPALLDLYLEFWVSHTCLHSLLHAEAVKAAHSGNTSLQLLVPANLSPYCDFCDYCELGCHQGLPVNENGERSQFVPIPRDFPE